MRYKHIKNGVCWWEFQPVPKGDSNKLYGRFMWIYFGILSFKPAKIKMYALTIAVVIDKDEGMEGRETAKKEALRKGWKDLSAVLKQGKSKDLYAPYSFDELVAVAPISTLPENYKDRITFYYED